jgi:hypothetical protein
MLTLYYVERVSDRDMTQVMSVYHPQARQMPDLDMSSVPSDQEASWLRGLGIDSSLTFPLFAEGGGAKKLIQIHRSWSQDKDSLWLVPVFETSIHFSLRARLLEWMSLNGCWLSRTFEHEVVRLAPSQVHIYSLEHESVSAVDLLDSATTGGPPRTRVVYNDDRGLIVPWRER